MTSVNGHMQDPSALSMIGTVVDHDLDNFPKTTSPGALSGDDNAPPAMNRGENRDRQDIPSYIPEDHPHRTLILCFDGTGDQFDADNSNIVQLVSLLKKDDRARQLVYYQAGIGTYTAPNIATPFVSRIRKKLDEMFAWNLHAHVMSGYEFLMQNYLAGDKICIFGFSRGAYTARSLAGMIHKVGLLPAGNFQQVPFAYKMFTRTDEVGWEQSTEFKKVFSVDVKIEFVGVWDTVDSVGIIPKRLPFTTSNTIVRTFRHAIALDERRAKLKANLWNRPNAKEAKLGLPESAISDSAALQEEAIFDEPAQQPTGTASKDLESQNGNKHGTAHKKKATHKQNERDRRLNTLERLYSQECDEMTNIEEVWFAGCHCDVGGGSVSNKTRHSLARIPLRWMVRECFKTNTGIMFNSEALLSIGLDPATLYPFVVTRPPHLPLSPTDRITSRPSNPVPIRPHLYLKNKHHPEIKAIVEEARIPFLGSEEEEELKDALSPKYDQLQIKKSWWFLEILPMNLRYQRADNKWVSEFGSNMARPRFIPKQRTNGFKVHRSVKMRMEAEYEDQQARNRGKRYAPKPHFKIEPTWMD